MEKENIRIENIAIISSNLPTAKAIEISLKKLINITTPDQADLIIVIGGDGSMLHALHNYMHLDIPFYGINAGSVGFMMNKFHIENFKENRVYIFLILIFLKKLNNLEELTLKIYSIKYKWKQMEIQPIFQFL